MKKLFPTIVLGYLSVQILASAVSAISDPVTGLIIDDRTRDPLPFANIIVIGIHKGTVSNAEGRFAFDRKDIPPDDTIQFSYMGYETLRIPISEMNRKNRIRMKQASINLEEVQVSSRTITAKEIVAMAEENFMKNHPRYNLRQELFFHSYEKVPFSTTNGIKVNKSDFPGLDEENLEELLAMMPDEFIGYQDAIFNIYNDGDREKLIPSEGISLEEGSMEALGREMETRLGEMFADIQQTRQDEDIYYQFKSGIFRHKFKGDEVEDSLWNEYLNDTLNYTLETSEIKKQVQSVLKHNTTPSGKHWEFIRERGKYEYIKEEVTIYNDEFVYRISFRPKKKGKFSGEIYISVDDFGIMQVDYAYPEGREDKKFSIAGFSHQVKSVSGSVIFEKRKSGYYPKYISAYSHEAAGVDRKFSILNCF